jgi:hypothetical protein
MKIWNKISKKVYFYQLLMVIFFLCLVPSLQFIQTLSYSEYFSNKYINLIILSCLFYLIISLNIDNKKNFSTFSKMLLFFVILSLAKVNCSRLTDFTDYIDELDGRIDTKSTIRPKHTGQYDLILDIPLVDINKLTLINAKHVSDIYIKLEISTNSLKKIIYYPIGVYFSMNQYLVTDYGVYAGYFIADEEYNIEFNFGARKVDENLPPIYQYRLGTPGYFVLVPDNSEQGKQFSDLNIKKGLEKQFTNSKFKLTSIISRNHVFLLDLIFGGQLSETINLTLIIGLYIIYLYILYYANKLFIFIYLCIRKNYE